MVYTGYPKHLRASQNAWAKLKHAADESKTQSIGGILEEVMTGKRDPVSMRLLEGAQEN